MISTYDRNHVNQLLFLKSNQISPAFCAGRRNNPSSADVLFTLTFFLYCSEEQLKLLNSMVKEEEKEVLVEFFQEVPGESAKQLSISEMKSFDFTRAWKAHRMSLMWDDLREVNQPSLAITFTT